MNLLFLCAQAFAATITVGSSGEDYATIQEAIDNSTPGDVIAVTKDTYNEAIEIDGRTLTILGNQSTLSPPTSMDAVRLLSAAQVTLDEFQILPNGARALYSEDSDSNITGFTIADTGNGASLNGGAIYVDGGSLVLNDTSITNSDGSWGGAVYAINEASLNWDQVSITETTGDFGGALYLDDATLTASGLTVTNTEAGFSGGGLYLVRATVDLSDFELNDSKGDETWGAGIYAQSTTLSIQSGLITDCEALNYLSGYGGGAIRATSTSTLDFFNVHIANSAAYFGGGLSLASSTSATLSDFSASGNLVANIPGNATGGALHIGANAEATCLNCLFDDNTADRGAAVAVEAGGSFSDENGHYTQNQSSDLGGAIHISDGAQIDFSGSSFEQNSARTGGALWYSDSSLAATLLSEVHFVENVATDAGGAIAVVGPANLTLQISSFTSNSASSGSGGAISLEGSSGALYSMTIEESLFLTNNASTDGGAITAGEKGELYIQDTTFDTNTATSAGGALVSDGPAPLIITATVFQSNASGSTGGAWTHRSGSASATATIWLENSSLNGGAVASLNPSDTLFLVNNSFVANEAYGDGAHLWAQSSKVESTNNIYAHGVGGGGVYADSTAASSMTLQYGDSWQNSGGNYAGQISDPTGTNGNISDDPLFREYPAVGAGEPDLHLQNGSSCVDVGDPSIFDLDSSRSDIGAYGGGDVATSDDDGDGYLDLIDCDDEDPTINPGASEVPYDTIDQDCDGADLTDVDGDGVDGLAVGGEDCDDENDGVFPGATETYYDDVDQNCDGLSDFDADGDGEDSDEHGGSDCDDTDPTISPLAAETLYDGVDQDCDGLSDFDADQDGYDADNFGGTDCDDTNSAVNPEEAEIPYDAIDQDCDGFDLTDVDRDGYDAENEGGTDCDDTNAGVNPGATELPYDGIDQNCDGLSDYDADQDGYDSDVHGGADCDDADPATNPLADEIYYDGDDQNCDGLSDYDADEDGEDAVHAGGSDCNDTDPTVNTLANETYYDGDDQDCDGLSDYDYDRDGYDHDGYGGFDCDDTDVTINPASPEIAYDGIDQDCDGTDWDDVDEDGYIGSLAGGSDCDDNNSAINPSIPETWYDGVDQDCDGLSDYDADYDGYEADGYGGTDCDDTDSSTNPGASEVWYDGVDADCLGDDDYDADADGYPVDTDCDDTRPEAYPGAPELDNGLDDDCDGFSEDVDRDNDGLTDWEEWQRGTDPELADTDGDGLTDAEEAPDLPPVDTDGDGKIDALDPDDDGDGIPTLEEILADVDGDNKADMDVDGDGIPNHQDLDSDGDSLTDRVEGTRDTDGDGIADYIDFTGDYVGGGCGGGQSGGLLLSLLVIARRRRGWLTAAALLPSTGLAQSFEVDNFQWLGSLGEVRSPLRLSVPVGDEHQPFALGTLVTYSKNPLMEAQPSAPEVIVGELMTTHIRLTTSPVQGLQVDADLPVFAAGSRYNERFHGTGDLRIGLRGTITEAAAARPAVGLSLLSWVPTGDALLGLGHTYASIGMLASAAHSIGPLHLVANLGGRLGPSDSIRNLRTGTGPLLGFSAGFTPVDSLGLHLECVSQGSNGWDRLALELLGSAKWQTPQGFWFSGAWGAGLTEAVGSPAWRGVASLGWRWRPPPEQAPPSPVVVHFPRDKKVAKPTKPRVSNKVVSASVSPLAEVVHNRIILHENIYFEEGSAILLQQSTPVLEAVLDILFIHLEIQHLLIGGHTNHHGVYAANLGLSERRSETVLNWLVRHGVNPHRLVSKGYGSHRPLVDPNHPEALEINRRVEFTILRPDTEADSPRAVHP